MSHVNVTYAIYHTINDKRYYYSGTANRVRRWRTRRKHAHIWYKRPDCEDFLKTLGRGTIGVITF